MKSPQELKAKVQDDISQVFAREIDFDHQFGDTRRKNGDFVKGNPRDTIDLGIMEDSTFVTRMDLNGIEIQSVVYYAGYVMEDRPELEEELIDEIDPEYLVANLIAFNMQNFVL